ncbi:A-kinase anchor protein 10, mitochondrial [Drosophila teissieri]|uniref:A-kinase anchor protein 10, mitochondrial n=1 Tax=Drosophila teissieri TaxID=7243 RepID=UPI001CBA4975|nr:A-kinase anchor protein 10, mitochondrial [Drosophila teissieri]
MLNYIKRHTSRRRSSQDATDASCGQMPAYDVDSPDGAADGAMAHKRHSLRSTTSFCDEVFLEAEEEGGVGSAGGGAGGGAPSDGISLASNDDIFTYNSRLSMNLASIVNDPNCLSFFVQYLETRQALPLIKFYLDIENFKRAALTQEKEEPEDPPRKAMEQSSPHKDDKDVPELKTLCDLSMRKPLTDDEKSRIYAETNKQINRQKSGTECVMNSELSRASISDAIAIYQKYLIVNASLQVELPIVILAHISLLLCGRDKSECSKPIPANCFDEAREFVLEQLERDHVQGFLQSGYYSTYCLELIEGGSINIYDVLNSELALFYFTEYLEQRQERECLEFWITGINFRKSFASGEEKEEDRKAAQSDAMIIYDKYFSLQSECRLWMSQKLRLRVEQAICAPGEQWQAFDLALLVTAKYLEQKYFVDFLKSHIFDNYVNELKVKRDISTPHPNLQKKLSLRRAAKSSNAQQRHRKTLSMSDCTHISQHNTLLASMDQAPSKTGINHQSGNLNIDARQLTNPQLLWQRPTGALKFGFVNSLGRYERDFEAVDAVALKSQPWSLTVSGNKLKNAMRKLVNLPEDNVQEEIAWQVAEMIVRDVTSVTLSGKTPPLA